MERYELFVGLELVRVALLPYFRGQVGRPEEDRAALARAFIAKAVFDVPTTRGLIERLEVDGRLSGCAAGAVPAGFRARRRFRGPFPSLPRASGRRLHETLIARTMDGHLATSRGMRRRLKRGRSRRRSEGSEAEAAQAGAATQGRGAGEGAEPAGTATDDVPQMGRPAEGLRCRQQAQRQGPYHLLDRVQAARRYRRWRDPHQLHHDVCVDA